MGFGKWLKGATRIRFDDRTLGNLTKNAAVGAGTALGGPLGLAVAGAGSAAGQKMLGGSWKDAAGAGLKGASAAGGINAARGLLSSVGSGAGAATSAAAPTTSANGSWLPGVGQAGQPAVSSGGGFSALNAAKDVGKFALDHDKVTGAVLNTGGNLLGGGSARRVEDAQARLLEQQAEESEYDYMQRKQREQQFAPLWGSLGTAIGSNYNAVAKNPYLPAGA